MFVAGTWFRKKAFVATVTKAVKHGRRWKREKHGRRWERDSRALRRVHSTASRRTKSYPESTRETMGSSPQFLGQRTVYAIFGIPGIPSSVAATEKEPDSHSIPSAKTASHGMGTPQCMLCSSNNALLNTILNACMIFSTRGRALT